MNASQNVKPMFIPLCAEWFDRFATGTKRTEWRAYGPRWNTDVAYRGRAVTLSRGYGKHNRLSGVVRSARRVARADAPPEARAIYPRARHFLAIGVDLAQS